MTPDTDPVASLHRRGKQTLCHRAILLMQRATATVQYCGGQPWKKDAMLNATVKMLISHWATLDGSGESKAHGFTAVPSRLPTRLCFNDNNRLSLSKIPTSRICIFSRLDEAYIVGLPTRVY